ncbi:MAG: 6-hydroxypseudooxynicotine dehydrogenase complex subunit alpha [Syntrophorhabdaceae bacterium PtaU1.Bin034]|jgi:carbon-monoxide dehydrogenase medium subunit|nr:MAG: 6-hydroxypseudooxynicotine dehydrogenase complex subunit alpha [Syntrophorhabdaceae bacterium PtaU1.Bin034]
MKLPQFGYFTPTSIEQACILMERYGAEASVLAGGTDLLVKMKQRRLVPRYVINLKTIPGLDYIRYDESDGLRLGALATIQSIKNSIILKRNFRVLHEAAGVESSVQIRNRATIAGNIANASPAADAPLALITLNASVVIANASGQREILVEDFLVGPGKTALQQGEVIREIHVPPLTAGSGGAYMKHAVRRTDIAIVSASAVLTLEDGVCTEARIGIGSVAPTSIRARAAEAVLKGQTITDDIVEKAAEAALSEARPIDDIRAYAQYRALALKTAVQGVIAEAVRDARWGGV